MSTRSSGRHCAVHGCTYNQRKLKERLKLPCCDHFPLTKGECPCELPFTFFSLPKDEERKKQWIDVLRLKRMPKDLCVCSFHFIDKRPTEENPVPTLFLGYERLATTIANPVSDTNSSRTSKPGISANLKLAKGGKDKTSSQVDYVPSIFPKKSTSNRKSKKKKAQDTKTSKASKNKTISKAVKGIKKKRKELADFFHSAYENDSFDANSSTEMHETEPSSIEEKSESTHLTNPIKVLKSCPSPPSSSEYQGCKQDFTDIPMVLDCSSADQISTKDMSLNKAKVTPGNLVRFHRSVRRKTMNMLFKSRAEHPNQSDRTTSNTVSPDNQSQPLSHICMPYLEMCLDHRDYTKKMLKGKILVTKESSHKSTNNKSALYNDCVVTSVQNESKITGVEIKTEPKERDVIDVSDFEHNASYLKSTKCVQGAKVKTQIKMQKLECSQHLASADIGLIVPNFKTAELKSNANIKEETESAPFMKLNTSFVSDVNIKTELCSQSCVEEMEIESCVVIKTESLSDTESKKEQSCKTLCNVLRTESSTAGCSELCEETDEEFSKLPIHFAISAESSLDHQISSFGTSSTISAADPASKVSPIHHKTAQAHSVKKPYICKVCQKAFRLKRFLTIHFKVHTSGKCYTCVVCGAVFEQSCELKLHKKSHAGSKRFVCQGCGAIYNQLSAFFKHMKSHIDRNPGFPLKILYVPRK